MMDKVIDYDRGSSQFGVLKARTMYLLCCALLNWMLLSLLVGAGDGVCPVWRLMIHGDWDAWGVQKLTIGLGCLVVWSSVVLHSRPVGRILGLIGVGGLALGWLTLAYVDKHRNYTFLIDSVPLIGVMLLTFAVLLWIPQGGIGAARNGGIGGGRS